MVDKNYMLTTIDNPYSPFKEYDQWLNFDTAMGYGTPEVLARIVHSSYEISDVDQELEIQRAIEEVVRVNALGIYKRVLK